MVETRGFEPPTYALRTHRSPSELRPQNISVKEEVGREKEEGKTAHP